MPDFQWYYAPIIVKLEGGGQGGLRGGDFNFFFQKN